MPSTPYETSPPAADGGLPRWAEEEASVPAALTPAASAPAALAPGSSAARGSRSLKILVAGGFGVGKTTLVGTVSEVRPLRTEELLTETGMGVDDLDGLPHKTTTTVAMDFGRITFSDDFTLYLFGTPGQERFWFMWPDIAYGAVGAVVLVDTRRLPASFSSIDFFEQHHTPFIVAVNCFDGAKRHSVEQVRTALDLDPHVPVVLGDVRRHDSVKRILTTLVQHAIDMDGAAPERPRGSSAV